ncbi:serine/threonine protein kinase [Taxawa tesnikishii (nom. ined.)]|nr:serine/threonine protein kinase [Dothideales sp. JES 119]
MPPPPRAGTIPVGPSPAPHGHNRHVGAAQAIFTTEPQAPWTVTSANDLACLVFGVTRAEVRKMGIMEVIKEERRKWLEAKLRHPEQEPPRTGSPSQGLRPPQSSQSQRNSPSPTNALSMGNGVTAKLLSKPPARQTYQSRRSKTAEGIGVAQANKGKITPGHITHKSRGVLLCGDVVPIQKRNGDVGSASLWVKEKQGHLIWVLEEIAEDVAYLTVDEVGCVTKGAGAVELIWGMERVRRGMDIKKLLPELPKTVGTYTGALDYDRIQELRRFTARTANSISIPVTVDRISGEPTFRVSSFPHIAGIMVLNSETLNITSSNSVFSAALFGQDRPDGMHINDLIPAFDGILNLMTDEDKIRLVDGIVIPEHSFRRARSLLALREGKTDAASIFLRPSGLPAKHRDGSEIMVDVQMRVVKSDKQDPAFSEVILEENEDEFAVQSASEVVYALWITYSRQLHAVNHGVGLVTPLMSRSGTASHQIAPGQGQPVPVVLEGDSSEGSTPSPSREEPPVSLLTQQIEEASSQPITSGSDSEPFEHPSPEAAAAGACIVRKKAISDFTILEEMGQGAYGQVKLARYRRANAKKMVIKYVTKRRILVDTWTRDRRLGTVPLEIHVLDYLRRDGLQHPNIVEMADFFEDDVNYYIEMIPHGLPGMDLFDYIELRVNMEERECRKIFVQVANALHHLHVKAKVVHRDIKDENVVLDGDGAVKLVDFGSAAYIKSGPFDVFVGTIDYAAPEVLRGSPYRGKEQDVWALGILLYTIVYKENPFYSIDEIMDHDLRVPYVLSEDCIDLIRKMLDRDEDE